MYGLCERELAWVLRSCSHSEFKRGKVSEKSRGAALLIRYAVYTLALRDLKDLAFSPAHLLAASRADIAVSQRLRKRQEIELRVVRRIRAITKVTSTGQVHRFLSVSSCYEGI